MKLNRVIYAAFLLLCTSGCQTQPDNAVQPVQPTETPDAAVEPAVPVEGIAEGVIGQTMRTAFFDFQVNSAKMTDTCQGYVPPDGYAILNVNITVHNTLDQELNMYDTDFQITWGEGEDEWDIPLTYAVSTLSGDDLLKTAYKLHKNESITGDIVYQVPADSDYYIFSYLEQFSDDTEGDLFAVYFGLEE
ncbi:MAG: DUF4352 domain-containing protein [Solobacterium sp.]|nr:DUF4352 domain-containing protein [Solobacterium sp.]